MNLQEIFTKAFIGLREQGFQTALANDGLECRYIAPGTGRKCAIGHALPDGAYHPDLEGQTADEPAVLQALQYEGDTDLLVRLQGCHDWADNRCSSR